ncbi:MAG: enoyl-CoA hydratase/isomerase family protein [Pigmentiphaga sp.]|uniref:enoyl-CoA hydratase/isomerase family protein n=1 Tax=Pigmentiphaga sp. TaxID=1977564 RepID=UPI0029BC8A6E|nr:enoyl-CoA hydratase/isomerase family protein [Pigmentiphaga sp.]MDX3906407.1 enoyl-CoA hydratase/isomerase family protein [Pigmentiphaga sp.]
MNQGHAATEAELVVSTEGHVRLLRLNRPERRNALSRGLMVAIIEAMLDAEEDDDVRVIVLTGTGDSAFCAGGDLKEMRGNDEAGARFRSPMNRVERNVFEVVLEAKKPTIAALNGSAVAGGFELALACDLRISHPGAQFGLPETKIGMGANFGSVLLPRRVAPGIALEMLFTGDYIDAAEAHRLGLLNRVVAPEQVLPASLELARKIAGNAPISVRRVKAVAMRGLDMPVAAALRQDPGANPYLSEDRKEGIRARLEKRKPVWQNR